MTGTALFFALAAALSAVYGYSVGSARARRTEALWEGIKQGKIESLAVVAVVAAVMLYQWFSYESPS